MPTSHLPPPERLLLGMFFMCLASTMFPMMNGLVQVLSVRYPSEQIVWARCVAPYALLRFGLVPTLFLPVGSSLQAQ